MHRTQWCLPGWAQEVAVWLAVQFGLPKGTIHVPQTELENPLKILRSQTVFYLSD